MVKGSDGQILTNPLETDPLKIHENNLRLNRAINEAYAAT
jgi:hypothetical protein